MKSIDWFKENIFGTTSQNFEERALALFRIQSIENKVYRKYLSFLNIEPFRIKHLEEIPFMPIEFFKIHEVKTSNWKTEKIFKVAGPQAPIKANIILIV